MFILQTKEDYDVRAIAFFLFAQKIEKPLISFVCTKKSKNPLSLHYKNSQPMAHSLLVERAQEISSILQSYDIRRFRSIAP